jgi:squalene cyclase
LLLIAYRRRKLMEKSWWSLVLAALIAAMALGGAGLLVTGPAVAAPARQIPSPLAPEHAEVISRALAYLAEQQVADGGMPGVSPGTSDAFSTIKAVIALAALGMSQDTLAHTETGRTMVGFLEMHAVTYTYDASGHLFPGRAGMLAVSVVAADAAPSNFAGANWIEALQATFNPVTGAYSSTALSGWTSGAASSVNQVWSMLGLAAAQASVPAEAVDFLLDLQEADGGWGYGFGGDTDTTGLALQALMASGHITPEHAAVLDALSFLHAQQDDQGSWGYVFGDTYTASPDSTASVMQALVALGYTPATETWRVPGGGNPHTALAAMQAADGSFSANALGTAHALAGLAEAPLPLFGRWQRARLALTALAEAQNADGSWSDFGAPSAGATADAVLAFASANFSPPALALDYLSTTAATYVAYGPDAAGKLLMAVVAAGENPQSFGGVHLMDQVRGYYSATVGAFVGDPTNVWHQSLAVLGLVAAGEPLSSTPVVSAAETLVDLQQANGGWGYNATWNLTTVDNTALAMQALVAAGEPLSSTAIVSATAYLKATQDAKAGWGNANATAFAIQGLVAAGEHVSAPAWRKAGRTPFAALEDYQKPDGPFVYNLEARAALVDSGFATRQAVPALVGQPFPLASPTTVAVSAARMNQALSPWEPVVRGPDPDRLVAGTLRYDAATQTLVFPFGSDLDRNAGVTGTWFLEGSMAAVPFTMMRGAARFTATLPVSDVEAYDIQIYVTDRQGVQGETVHQLEIGGGWGIFLPVVVRNFPGM